MNKRLIILPALVVNLLACNHQNTSARSTDAVRGLPNDTEILVVNGKTIKAGDIELQMQVKLAQAREHLMSDYRTEALEHAYQLLLLEVALKNGSKDVQSYLKSLKEKIEISDPEIAQFLKANALTHLSYEQAKKFLIDQHFITLEQELRNTLMPTQKQEWKLLPAAP